MTTTINKSTLKARMLEECIRKQESLIEDFKQRIQALLGNDTLGNEEEYDNTTLAQNSQIADEVNLLTTALTFANNEMAILRDLKLKISMPYTSPATGAVVVTNRSVFFISVSIEQFEVDGKAFIGLSDKSPLFEKMKGKKKGQKFSFKGITYNISDVF